MLHGTVGQAAPAPRAIAPLRARKRAAALLLWAAVFAGFALFFTRPARLFDADSYLHLALARDFGTHALADRLVWARFSTLGQSYGDKELLFHFLLAPFANALDPELGGKLGLALLCCALTWTLWRFGRQALGARGWLVPVLVFGSGSFLLRALRLRPELLALLVLLWVVWALAERRYRLAALLAVAFTLSHTAFHSLLGLAGLFFLWVAWSERRWEWQLPAAVGLGVAAGVLVHPQFPRNLDVFWVQNVTLFQLRAGLAVGEEFQPHSTWDLVTLDGVAWLGLLALWAARERDPAAGEAPRRFASMCWIAAAAFGALFAQMGRFSTLFVPFLVLGVAFELRARGDRVGEQVALPGGRSFGSAAVFGVVAALSGVLAGATAFVNWHMAGSFDPGLRRELEAMARALPDGARVAASWSDAELYAFHAPQARYLNVYDPVFMAVGDPLRHSVWTRVQAGDVPDVPGAVSTALDSEYLAFAAHGGEALLRRLAADPRAELLHRGQHLLYRLRGGGRFVTDWMLEASGAAVPAGAYVDLRASLGPDGCAVVRRVEPAGAERVRVFELAASGPTVVFIDGQQRLQLPAASGARLGEGAGLPLRAGLEQTWRVRTCGTEGEAGFYWLER